MLGNGLAKSHEIFAKPFPYAGIIQIRCIEGFVSARLSPGTPNGCQQYKCYRWSAGLSN